MTFYRVQIQVVRYNKKSRTSPVQEVLFHRYAWPA